MQLNLLTRLGARVVMSRAEPPSTVPGAWRDSAISQLEALARANERAATRARRRRRLWTAGLSSVVLLWGAAMWRQAIDPPRVPAPMLAQASTPVAPLEPAAAPAAPAAPVAAVVAEVSLASAAPTLLTAASVAAGAAETATAPSSSVVSDAVPVVASTDDEAARKARVQWQARRKAAQLAQERARAEQEAQQRQLALAAQLDAERTLQQQLAEAAARDRAAAAERERRQALLLAQNTRRGVVELCANSGGVAGEQQCHTRQCWKAEHQGDPVCLRLREGELARLQRGADH